jgi:hypothetical protein
MWKLCELGNKRAEMKKVGPQIEGQPYFSYAGINVPEKICQASADFATKLNTM